MGSNLKLIDSLMILFTDSNFVAPLRGWCRGFSNNVINRSLSESLLSYLSLYHRTVD